MFLNPNAPRTLSWKFKLAVIFLAFIVAPLSPARADENNDAKFREIPGTVVDKQGSPIAGASVWHAYAFAKKGYRRIEASASTDAAGRFLLKVPTKLNDDEVASNSNGTWAYSPKHCIGCARCVSDPKKPEDNQIVLAPSTDTSLVVLDPEGNPVEGAVVEPVNYRNYAGYDLVPQGATPILARRTDAEGRVAMPSMARDRLFLVQVTSEDYGTQTQQFIVHPDAPAERTINLRQVTRIEGQFTAENLKWAQGIQVTITSEQQAGQGRTQGKANVITDASGRFVIPKIADGRISMIEFTVDEDLPVRPKLPQTTELAADTVTLLHIPMIELVDIRGAIVAEDTGEPLPDIKIHVYYGTDRQGTDVVSDEKGEFTARVMPGNVRFQPQNLSTTKYVQLGSPVPFNVPEDAEDFEAPTIRPVPTEPIDGTLVDQDDAPVGNVEIIAYYRNWLCSTAKTDKDGKFRLPKLPTSIGPGEATYRVVLGVGETRHMRTGDVAITDSDPLIISVKR